MDADLSSLTPQGGDAPRLLVLSGSFHSQSKSMALARIVCELLPQCRCEIPAIEGLPFYSEDLNRERPEAVRAFLAQVEQCDGIVFVTPEYNHSIPAVLKNAIDWASRPAFASPLRGKPATIITQSANLVGGARAQAHLKLVLDATLSIIHPYHEMLIVEADRIFQEGSGELDPAVRTRLLRHVEDFLRFVGLVRLARSGG